MTLKTGQVVNYFIDNQTFLVKQVEATGDMALNLTGFGSMMKAFGSNIRKDTKATMLIKEYGDFSGIKYPVKLVLSFGPVTSNIENLPVKISGRGKSRFTFCYVLCLRAFDAFKLSSKPSFIFC